MYTMKQINQLIDKVKIRPLFSSGLSLPNRERSSCLLNGRNFFVRNMENPVFLISMAQV